MNYPCRVRIIDADGQPVGDTGAVAATPAESRPHIGKHGTAGVDRDGDVCIVLDDGNVLYGYECWWVPAEDE